MTQPLRVLIVEDLPTDAELAEREIKKIIGPSTFHRVETREEFLSSLDTFHPDIILSDYRMPRFDGLTALKLAIEHVPDIPVIILTSAINEDTAVECMKAGAVDYVIKEHIKRLGQAVIHALEEKRIRMERRQTVKELERSEARYRTLFNHSPSVIILEDTDGTILDINDTISKILGYTRDELIGKHVSILSSTEHQPVIASNIANVLSGNNLHHEVNNIAKDGSVHRWELRENAVTLPDGRTGILVVANDITEQRKMEQTLRKSQDRLRLFFNQSLDGFYFSMLDEPQEWGENIDKEKVLDYAFSHQRITDANEAMLLQYGTTHDKLINRPLSDFFKHDTENGRNLRRRLFDEGHLTVETNERKDDGTPIWIEGDYVCMHDEHHRITGTFGIQRDITLRKHGEELLKKQSTAMNTSFDGMAILNSDGIYVYLNDAHAKIYGYDHADELIGKSWEILYDENESVRFHESIMPYLWKTGHWQGEAIGKRRDGTTYPQELSLDNLDDGGLVCVVRDITERKRVERVLRESEELYRKLVTSIPDIIVRSDLEGNIVYINDVNLKVLGYESSKDIIGRNIRSLIAPEDAERANRNIKRMFEKHVGLQEYKVLLTDQSTLDCEVNGEVLRNVDGTPYGMVFIVRDITERKRVEKKVTEQARLLDIALDAIMVRDMDDHLIYLNKAAEVMHELPADTLRKLPMQNIILPEDWGKYEQAKITVLSEGVWEGELRQRNQTNAMRIIQTRWTLIRDHEGNPTSRLIINRDITEQRNLESQLRHTQRLESLGTLASGIAHDLNNVLSPIMMSVELLKSRLVDPKAKNILTSLETSAQRGSDIVKQVLAFARGTEKEFAPQQLRYIVKEIQSIINETFSKNISLNTDLPSDLSLIIGDSTQLHQVLMNLCVNARDAMPNGGQLTISASNISVDEAYARTQAGIEPGEYVSLSVRDTGSGIPKEIHEKIFEPFFTTKETGLGTGLGLSTVYSIVKGHNGTIKLHSELGRGTEFTIFFPAIKNELNTFPTSKSTVIHTGYGETILVIDDEFSVLQICKETLETHGYRVLTAIDGPEAIAIFSKMKATIDLVLTDINMPFMDGPTTIKTLRRLKPDFKVILSSGLPIDAKSIDLKGITLDLYLSKPYSAVKLLESIHKVLNDSRTS
jgi:two-component system, cell cycle sensor histidine kinase and response regulator CckA